MSTPPTPVRMLRVDSCTRGIIGPGQPMLGPLADGGRRVAGAPPGCWGPMITPAFQGGHEVTQPVMIAGAEVGDAVALKIDRMRVTSSATSSGVMRCVDGRYRGEPFVAMLCSCCGEEHPAGHVEGIGADAIRCDACGAEVSAFRFAHGYVMVFDHEHQLGLTLQQVVADLLAGRALQAAALPELAEQHAVLSLARTDMPGLASLMRPFLGNIGSTPARDLPDSHNCAGLGQHLVEAPHRYGMNRKELDAARTDGHMDTNSVREGCIVIGPVKVPGAGVYLGDMHARQGNGELADHATDVSGETGLTVEVIKGLRIDGPIFIGGATDLNAATRDGQVTGRPYDEVLNRAAIAGSIEISRLPGTVRVTIACPFAILDRLGIGHLVRPKYAF